MTDILKIKHVSWLREKTAILQDINWSVAKGEHWSILGLNGSGKTTLLNMINGYIWPTSGEICVLEHPFGKTDLRELRKKIGWVSSSLQERIGGTELAENVVISGEYASIGLYEQPTWDNYRIAKGLMEKLGCAHLLGKSYQTCSQGEKQRLLIARGLMAKPELLILDEPTNGLDFLAREDLLRVISELALSEDAPTILFVTHHMDEVLPVFTHTLLLKDGSVFGKGKTKEIATSNVLSSFFGREVDVDTRNGRVQVLLKGSYNNEFL
ncbi:ABC transporter ATP-binding protein [Virgibacillus halodenitrificans]|uniref:ABC transporter ATP-binding protein n=1 Tax=Virgibacillus halodenitrificans TaxID=1482 RepID=UPI00045D0B29|nr:ABC transporter ATP-binding protein [Virgibacillus halodenitrificans]CDQ32399.1 putative ABC transporter ATP-binding protein YlmA [Virgibacillus halodenitrificans]